MSTNRKMRNLCRIAFMLAACTALTFMTSCKKEEVRDQGATIPDEVINRLQVIGLGTDDIQVDPEGGYLVEGCLHMTEEQIFEQFTDLTVDGGTELDRPAAPGGLGPRRARGALAYRPARGRNLPIPAASSGRRCRSGTGARRHAASRRPGGG